MIRGIQPLIIAFTIFTISVGYTAFVGFYLPIWLWGITSVFMLIYSALRVEKVNHTWMAVYSFQGGTGRMFFTSETGKVHKAFIIAVDECIKKNPATPSAFVINLVYLGLTVE